MKISARQLTIWMSPISKGMISRYVFGMKMVSGSWRVGCVLTRSCGERELVEGT